MATFIPHCPRCNGQVLPDHGERRCLQCGHTLDNKTRISEFYTFNRSIIEPLVRQLAPKKCSELTGIPLGSIPRLRRTWGIKLGPLPAAVPEPGTNGQLPPLPAFSGSWSEPVQLAWLGVWHELQKSKREEVKTA